MCFSLMLRNFLSWEALLVDIIEVFFDFSVILEILVCPEVLERRDNGVFEFEIYVVVFTVSCTCRVSLFKVLVFYSEVI